MATGHFDPLNSRPTAFLCLFETADGCIKFLERGDAAPLVRFSILRPISARLGDVDRLEMAAQVRSYELHDRSGPGGMILHYREMVE